MPILFLLFILVPILEIALLIQVGSAIGGWTTIGIVLLTAVLGTAMLRHQGMATLAKAQNRMAQGEMPAHQLVEGLLLLVGGVLLLTPGFMTDAVGFACLIPLSREFLAKKLSKGALNSAWVVGGNMGGMGGIGAGHRPDAGQQGNAGQSVPNSGRPTPGSGKAGEVIDGDYKRID